jgi:hypothetical protein
MKPLFQFVSSFCILCLRRLRVKLLFALLLMFVLLPPMQVKKIRSAVFASRAFFVVPKR